MSIKRRMSKLEQRPENTGPLSVWYEHQDDETMFHNRKTGEHLALDQLDTVPGLKILVTREKTPIPERRT